MLTPPRPRHAGRLAGYGPFAPVAQSRDEFERTLTLAVLPFQWLGRPGDDYAADAMTDELISALSRLPGVSVISRSTMFTYKGKAVDVREVGRDLRVQYVLEGTLRHAEAQLRINVALVNAQTAAELWAEGFEAPDVERGVMEGELVRRVARSLNLGIMDAQSQRLAGKRNADGDAFALAARGWVELFNKPQTPESNNRAMALLERSTALHPDVALAWTGLAYALWRAGSHAWTTEPRDELFARALAAAARAITLDPRIADAYYVTGIAHIWLGELQAAAASLETCLAINPSHAPACGAMGQISIFEGNPQQAPAYLEKAIRLSPKEPLRAVWHGHIAFAAALQGDCASTIEQARLSLLANADFPPAYMHLAAAHAQAGRLDESRGYLERYKQLAPRLATSAALMDRYGRSRNAAYRRMFASYLERLRSVGLE